MSVPLQSALPGFNMSAPFFGDCRTSRAVRRWQHCHRTVQMRSIYLLTSAVVSLRAPCRSTRKAGRSWSVLALHEALHHVWVCGCQYHSAPAAQQWICMRLRASCGRCCSIFVKQLGHFFGALLLPRPFFLNWGVRLRGGLRLP